ncbi:MAG: carboxypeptidase-like regulatory domain-containing protein, partial [Bacteroidota bacterium]
MRSILIIVLFTLLSIHAAFGYEIKGFVLSATDQTPIPYANIWVKDRPQGTSSDASGFFQIEIESPESAVLVVSSVGYARTETPVSKSELTILLAPQIKILDSILIKDTYHKETIMVGQVDKKNTHRYYGNGGNPWVVAQYFPYQNEYKETPFIDKISLLTVSNIKDAIFKLRILDADENSGKPKDDILSHEIIVKAKRGKKLTKVDISNYNIPVTRYGVYVAFEWIITPKNKYESTFTDDEGEKKKHMSYEPLIGAQTVQDGQRCWKYTNGQWENCGAWGTEMGN